MGQKLVAGEESMVLIKMESTTTNTILTSSLIFFLGLIFLSLVIKFLDKVWWTPIHVRSLMRSQGIEGPPYEFLNGNTKEITKMRRSAESRPVELSSNYLLSRIQPHVHSWMEQYGANFLNWYGPRPQLVVSDPSLVREILNNKNGAYPKYIIQEFADKLFGNGLSATRGEGWSKKRKLANYAFHGESLKNMIPAMIASVEAMLERWEEKGGGEIEVFREFTVLTSEIISRTAFGSSYLEGKNTFELLRKMSLIISRNNYRVRFRGTRWFWKAQDDTESDKLAKGIRESIIRMIKKREEDDPGEQEGYGVDFLGILLKANHEDDPAKRMSVDDVVDECKTFYVAGQETTASSLSWTLLLLATHSDWQDKARQEVIRSIGRQNPTPDVLPKLKILNMIIQESLRLYVPVFNITRETERDVRLGHLNLPAGMALSLPVLALHTNPDIWGQDVLRFRPDRFANGVGKASKDTPAAYIPFGMGPRTCVGMNFAMAEIKIALAMILQRYSFTLSPAYVHSPHHVLTIRPQHGLQIVFEPTYDK